MTELDLQKYLALSARTLKEEDFPGEAYDLARATRAEATSGNAGRPRRRQNVR